MPIEQIWVITADQHVGLVREHLPQLSDLQVVGEPCGRDTAPCIGLGAALIVRQDPEGVMIVTPADHVIEPEQEFRRAIGVAAQMAEEHASALVTFGIPPAHPATGYGYIHRDALLETRQSVPVYRVGSFKEKPSLETAQNYLATGEYYWNSGIFVWKVRTILDALEKNQPKMHAAVNRIADVWARPEQKTVFQREFDAMKRISIDYAVMENADEVLVLEAPYKWDDVGSWRALERMNPQDANGNTLNANHAGLETGNCIIVAEKDKLVTTIGVDNLLIVQDGDAILVADKNNEGAVKQLVDKLQKTGLEKYL